MNRIEEILASYDKTRRLKEKQKECFEYFLESRGDLLVSLPVGYGKSVIFHLLPQLLCEHPPPSQRPKTYPVVLVISPLNIIQKDQVQSLRSRKGEQGP
ncbi:hypothetical protein KP79_PYT08383 [Mizuhopecten yessoensis]|uniref:DEAD/DEAH-box helicase domain-containing protein n=1 Tax=Mizuhopecten yessoensis TaxID=6573 RepID=A0A210QEY9_MIZYE|nr:hypothetical protein KP79_PYT08383 [Mizuhopecten yessoensis]